MDSYGGCMAVVFQVLITSMIGYMMLLFMGKKITYPETGKEVIFSNI